MGKTINTILNLQDKFSGKLEEAGKKVLVFKITIKDCEETAKSTDKSLDKMGKTASDGKMDAAGKKIQTLENKLKSCGGEAKKVNKVLGAFIKTAAAMSTATTAGITVLAKSSLNTYKEFQQSMSNVAGISGKAVGSEEYKKLEAAAREAGKSTTKTAAESADALSYMALAGWTAEQQLEGLMPILRASEATGADLATTSDLITDSMSALGLKTNELQHYLDVCTKTQNNSNTSLTEMQEAYIGVGGTIKSLYDGTKSTNEILKESGAILGILANRSIRGSEAGNSLQSVLVNLTKKSGESAKAMKAIGVSAYDSNGKFKGITTVLKEVQAATKNMTAEQRNNYLAMIAGKTQLTTLNALMSGLSNTLEDGRNEYQALYDDIGNCDGALDMMADTMTNNYAGATARAGSAIDDFKITIGQKLEPYITKFLNWFSEKLPGATEKFALWLDQKIPKAINFCKSAFNLIKTPVTFIINNFSKLASVAAGVVASLVAFSALTKIASWYKKLQAAGSALKAVQLALNASMLACPLTWLAIAIGAVVGGILLYKDAIAEAKEEDLAEHFGNIELSAEECSKAIQSIFGQNAYMETDLAKSAYEAAQSSIEELSESSKKLNKREFDKESQRVQENFERT